MLTQEIFTKTLLPLERDIIIWVIMGKLATLLVITVLALSSLVMVVSVFAQSISKPSVPEFTVRFIKSSYNVTTTDPSTGASVTKQRDNNTIIVVIKNQLFIPYSVGSETNSTISSHYISLYYNVRTKNHFDYNWTEQYPSQIQPAPQSNLEYTVLSLQYLVQLPSNYNVAGGQIDFQVEAIIGNVTNVWDIIPEQYRSNQPLRYDERIWTIEQISGWSTTQTLTLPEDYIAPTFPPTPTITPYQVPERTKQFETIIGVAIVAVVIGAGLGLLLYFKKRKR
jgi:hypothetical protein